MLRETMRSGNKNVEYFNGKCNFVCLVGIVGKLLTISQRSPQVEFPTNISKQRFSMTKLLSSDWLKKSADLL